jgi:hypothetical protein
LTYQACHYVHATTGGKTDNDAHRPRRISLRTRDERDGRESCGARSQTEEFAAGKFH